MSPHRRAASFLLAAFCALCACQPPKYARYSPPSGDYLCEVPWGWTIYLDRSGSDYANALFVGPFDPEFYLGLPTLSVRWYAYGRPHRLRGNDSEVYASADDFIAKTLKEVYKNPLLIEARHKVEVSGREADHFVVFSPAEVPPQRLYGVSEEDGGRRAVNYRQHAYVVLPMSNGFYAIIYPATRAGYEKHLSGFNHLVNTFRVLKDGPKG